MATTIKGLPILYGSSSKRFNKILLSEQDMKVSPQERERIFNLVKRVLEKNIVKSGNK